MNSLTPPNQEVLQSDTFREAEKNLKVDLDGDWRNKHFYNFFQG